MGHDETLRPSRSARGKGDRRFDPARRASILNQLRTASILGRRLPATVEVMFDYSNLAACGMEIDRAAVLPAAEKIIAGVQDELRRQSSPLSDVTGLELAYARAWAVHALIACSASIKAAKERELEITNGSPLTICTGRHGNWNTLPFLGAPIVATAWGSTCRVPEYGCLTVFHDTTRTTGKMWRYWCPDCEPKNSQRLRAARRVQTRAMERIIRERIAIRAGPP